MKHILFTEVMLRVLIQTSMHRGYCKPITLGSRTYGIVAGRERGERVRQTHVAVDHARAEAVRGETGTLDSARL